MARSAKKRSKEPTKEKAAVTVPVQHEHVVVEGMAPRMQAFNLPHEIYCRRMGKCCCTEGEVVTSVRSAADQKTHLRVVKRKNNAVLTIRYRQRVAVPRVALQCPEVAAALASRRLRMRS